MKNTDHDERLDIIAAAIEEERRRSRRYIQTTYAVFALFAVAIAVLFYAFHNVIGVAASEGRFVGRSFLVLATANLVVLALWEKIWGRS